MLVVGADWRKRIESEVERADFIIPLLSENSVNSEMVELEIKLAHQLARENKGKPRLLPVRVNYLAPFPYPLSEYLNSIQWAYWSGDESTLKLVDELKRALAGEELSSPNIALQTSSLLANVPPAPAAKPTRLEQPEGTMDPESFFYIERDCDQPALNAIKRAGETIIIKGPRQMGKSSLLARTVREAINAGKQIAFLDFQFFDKATLTNPDLFYRQFCQLVGDELGVEDRVEEFWAKQQGNSIRATNYMQLHILKSVDSPITLAMDEVESVFDIPFRSDFFSMLRGWHNNRSMKPLWRKLDLVMVTSTEPYQLIENLNLSPFNVGQTLELRDFGLPQVKELNQRHGTPLNNAEEERLFTYLNGHPYLTRKALYLVANNQLTPSEFFKTASDSRGPFGDHLRHHLFRLQSRVELIEGMKRVIRSQSCPDESIFFRLEGAGLVRREGRVVVPRCRLYEGYFGEHL